LQSLAPTNPHLARVVGFGNPYGIHKEGLCPSNDDDDFSSLAKVLSKGIMAQLKSKSSYLM
jgi:hypothetical protein